LMTDFISVISQGCSYIDIQTNMRKYSKHSRKIKALVNFTIS
jgi:hypothetical protein